MNLETQWLVLLSLAAGMVGGLVSANLRMLHLEMSWHMVRTDLRKYYTRMRNDRALLETRPGSTLNHQVLPPDSEEAILERARQKGLLMR